MLQIVNFIADNSLILNNYHIFNTFENFKMKIKLLFNLYKNRLINYYIYVDIIFNSWLVIPP